MLVVDVLSNQLLEVVRAQAATVASAHASAVTVTQSKGHPFQMMMMQRHLERLQAQGRSWKLLLNTGQSGLQQQRSWQQRKQSGTATAALGQQHHRP